MRIAFYSTLQGMSWGGSEELWSAAAEFSIYLRDDITPDQRSAINRRRANGIAAQKR